MSSFNCFAEEQSRVVLRLLVLTRLLIKSSGISLERMQEYLHKKRLGVSARQLQRDLRALTTPLSLTSQSNEEGTCHYWRSKDSEAWREFFEPLGRGTTDLGSDPLGLDTPGSKPIVLEEPLQKPAMPCELGRIHQRLFRILCIVEMLPEEDDDVGMDVASIQLELQARGFEVTARTVARDLEIVREHFLVEVHSAGPRKQLWKRVDSGCWLSAFEPRFPSLNLDKSDAVKAFLYRNPPPARFMQPGKPLASSSNTAAPCSGHSASWTSGHYHHRQQGSASMNQTQTPNDTKRSQP